MSLPASHDFDGLKMTFVRQQKSLKFEKALNLTNIQKILLNKVLLVVIDQNLKIVLTFWICVPFSLFSMLLFIKGIILFGNTCIGKEKTTTILGFQKKTNKKIFCSKFSKKLQKWWKKPIYEQCWIHHQIVNFYPILTLIPSKFQVLFEVFK